MKIIKRKFSDLIITRLEQLMGFYAKYDTPSLLMKLCKKYPQHKKKLWFIWQVKEFAYYIAFYGLLFSVSTMCNPYIICYDCLQLVNNTYNVSAMTNTTLIKNFTTSFFDNITVIL